MDPFFLDFLRSIIGGVITGASAWMAIRVHIAWLRADIDRAHKRIDLIDRLLTNDED